ncbi:MAG: hypothetical protein WCT31_05610, partial [Candidatus Micrarchaeia archaeon]
MQTVTTQLRKIPRLRIATIRIEEPKLEELPGRFRIFKKNRAIQRNYLELERFNREIIAAVNAYEEEAKKWRSRGHFERAGWLCEMATIELGRVIRKNDEWEQAYSNAYKLLVAQAFDDFKTEITVMDRMDPNLYLGMARCLRRVLRDEEALEAEKRAHREKERMRSEPSFFDFVTINRLKKAIMENSHDNEVDKILILDLMGQIIDLTTGASVRYVGEARKEFIGNAIEGWL